MRQRIAITVSFSILIAMVSLIATGCGGSSSDTRTGKLTGQEVSMSLSDAVSGKVSDLGVDPEFGRVIVTEENGDEVKAFVPKAMEGSLRGAQTVEVKKIEGSDEWVVTKILEQP